MKPNFRYQELTLTNTPKKGSIHQRPLSYSRSLNRTPQNESANWQASENQGEHADSEVAHSRLRGGRTILKEYPLQKDDLLKILRGTNYVLSSQKDARLPSNSRVSRATGPILIKSHRGGLCAPGFKKSSR